MKYVFDAPLWRWQARADMWMFVSLPERASDEIRGLVGDLAGGFGSVPVTVRVGKTSWRTSIFPGGDGRYALPMKAAVRRAEHLELGDNATLELEVRI